jgi:RimJ/RimL family protein N-acetyltransferase
LVTLREKPLVIVTEHLVLREFEQGDFDALLVYQSDPRYLRYYPWAERKPEDVRTLHRKFLDNQHEQPRINFQLAMTLLADGTLIGNAGVRMKSADATEGDIGCELAPEYWGRDYSTEAKRAMLAFGFEQLHLHRLWASTISENSAARRVLEKLGMRLEGELRETTWLRDHWANSSIYAILEQEWQAERPASEEQPGFK